LIDEWTIYNDKILYSGQLQTRIEQMLPGKPIT